jgi:hydroxyacylglutathione hydrolase
MYRNLNSLVATLAVDTKIYCGHEYTVNNLTFALAVEPENIAIAEKRTWALGQSITVPSTIGSELETNPFMRVDVAAVQNFVGATDPIEVMARLREAKNAFGLGSRVAS